MIHVPAPTFLRHLWRDYFATPQDPHDKINPEKRKAISEDATDQHYTEGEALLEARYADRDVTVGRVQEVNSFIFNGIAALFAMTGAGMMTTVMFFSPMGLMLLPSLGLAGYSVICFLKGNESADDQVQPKHVADEYIEVLGRVKASQGSQKRYEERVNRSMKQRERLQKNNVWARRGNRMMRACIVSLFIELTVFSILIVVF